MKMKASKKKGMRMWDINMNMNMNMQTWTHLSMKMGEHLYKQAQENPEGSSNEAQPDHHQDGPQEGTIVDADYSETPHKETGMK